MGCIQSGAWEAILKSQLVQNVTASLCWIMATGNILLGLVGNSLMGWLSSREHRFLEIKTSHRHSLILVKVRWFPAAHLPGSSAVNLVDWRGAKALVMPRLPAQLVLPGLPSSPSANVVEFCFEICWNKIFGFCFVKNFKIFSFHSKSEQSQIVKFQNPPWHRIAVLCIPLGITPISTDGSGSLYTCFVLSWIGALANKLCMLSFNNIIMCSERYSDAYFYKLKINKHITAFWLIINI